MKRNKGDAEDFEPSAENDASDNERQPEWLRNAPASPFERPPRKSSAYSGSGHREDRHGERKDGRGSRSGARGYEREHTDSKRGGYASREEGRLMPIDADVLAYFPDPGAVNQALRALIPIIDARGARSERGARRANSPHYGENYGGREREHRAGRSAEAFGGRESAYQSKPRHSEGRARRDAGYSAAPRSFPPDRPPFARKRPRSL
jgi:hypothetical protein